MRKKCSKQMDMKKIAGIAILTSDKIDFKTKSITRENKSHYIILYGVV